MNTYTPKHFDYKWLAGGLAGIVLTLSGAAIGHWTTVLTSQTLTRENVREIVIQEALTKNDVQAAISNAISTAFTDVSSTKGMYVLEGKPRVDMHEEEIKDLQKQVSRLEVIQENIIKKLDQILVKVQ